MENSSLPYWEKRWGKNPNAFETSWPDAGCRRLELQYVKQTLLKLPPEMPVLEIGCGNFQLAEDPEIPEILKGRYLGVDGCPIALQAAKDRNLPHLHFCCLDLTGPLAFSACADEFGGPGEVFLLSKRTLQNIAPGMRRPLWEQITKFKGALVIEDFWKAREHTDTERHMIGRKPLEVPEFNWPISNWEVSDLELTTYPFMGFYYSITRVQPNVPDDIRVMALRLSQWALQEERPQPYCGPVIAAHLK